MPEKNDPMQVDPAYSKKVIEMLTVANEYCLFLEDLADKSKDDLLGYLQKICPLIYIKAALLTDIDTGDEDAAEHFVTEEQWEQIFNDLQVKFAGDDLYYFVDHHEKSHQDGVRASLSENLADIYQDLKDFLLLYQKPLKSAKENAVRDCKYLFETRFGYRLVNVQSAIHYLIFNEGEKGELTDILDSI